MEADDRAVLRVEPARGGTLYVCRLQRAIALQVRVDLARVAQEHVVLVQDVRLTAEAADALEARDELGLLLRLDALELHRSRALFGQPRDLGGDHRLDLRERHARPR